MMNGRSLRYPCLLSRFPTPQGALDMLILQILFLEPAHLYGAAQRLEADFAFHRSSESGVALSRSSPVGAEGMATAREKAIGSRSRSQVLFLDTFEKKATRHRERKWARLPGAVQMVFD